MQNHELADKEQGIRRGKAVPAHASAQTKAKKRTAEPKAHTNVNFEQGGRLDDDAQDQSLYDGAGLPRDRDADKQRHRGDSELKHEEPDEGPNDQQAEDLINYKGIYFNDNNEKYIDDSTGAHFRYDDIYQRLLIAKVERNRMDKELNISYSSQNDQWNEYSSAGAHERERDRSQSLKAAVSKERGQKPHNKNENRQGSKTKSSGQAATRTHKKESPDR